MRRASTFRAVCRGLVALAGLALLCPIATGAPAQPTAKDAALHAGLPLTPQMFGATGDGVADDTGPVEAWLRSGKPLFCSGVFRLHRAIVVDVPPASGVFVQGAGRQLCKLVLDTPAAGLTFRGGRPDLYHTPQIVLHDLDLSPAARLDGPALTIAFVGGAGATDPTVDLRNVAVKPAAPLFSAPTCIRLDNARNGTLDAINCEGPRGDYVPGSKGIVITGDGRPVELVLRGVNVYSFDEGIALEGTWQGMAITQTVCVGCRVGVLASASDDASTWLRVTDSHFNVEDAGIATVNIKNVDIFGNLIFLHDLGPSRGGPRACVDLRMTSTAILWAKIAGNTCTGVQAKTSLRVGVRLDSTQPPGDAVMETRIDGNSFSNLDWGVDLETAAGVALANNTFIAMASGEVREGSTGSGMFRNTQTPPPEPIRPGRN